MTITNTKLHPDYEQAKQFLGLIDSDAVSFTFQAFPERDGQKGKPVILHGTLANTWNQLVSLNQSGNAIAVVINETNGKGRKAADITRVRSLFVDLDGAPLAPVSNAAAPPNIIVNSSPEKYHAYWLVNDLGLADFKQYQQSLAAKFNGDPAVSDLSRVMRLPGFFHLKNKPFQTTIMRNS